MDSQNEETAGNSDSLASAMDEISLHPEANDLANENIEMSDAVEVNAKLIQSVNDVSYTFKDELLNSEEKNRRARGTRKGQKNGNNATNNNSNGTNIPKVNANEANDNGKSTTDTPKVNPIRDNVTRNAQGTPKRQRSAQNSPNESNDQSNRPKKQRTVAEVVAEDLKLQISNNPSGIGDSHLPIIESKLMDELDKYLATNPTSVPTFTSSFRYGTLRMFCSDVFSAEWITRTINEMTPPWDGANITCEPINRPPTSDGHLNQQRPQQQRQQRQTVRRPSIRFFIPDGVKKPTFEIAIKRLELQNPPLKTNSWIAWKAEEKSGGTFYHVSVDETDIACIKMKLNRLLYCFTRIKINLPREPNGDGSNVANNGNGNTQN